jgi:predicted DNA binding CopG/RHH family protein
MIEYNNNEEIDEIEFIDEEEKEIIESLYSEEWVSDFNEDIKKQYEEYARYSIEMRNKVEIYLRPMDLERIQVKALEEGLTHQALISMLVHKYNAGKLVMTA